MYRFNVYVFYIIYNSLCHSTSLIPFVFYVILCLYICLCFNIFCIYLLYNISICIHYNSYLVYIILFVDNIYWVEIFISFHKKSKMRSKISKMKTFHYMLTLMDIFDSKLSMGIRRWEIIWNFDFLGYEYNNCMLLSRYCYQQKFSVWRMWWRNNQTFLPIVLVGKSWWLGIS